jgi:hypothetical protein
VRPLDAAAGPASPAPRVGRIAVALGAGLIVLATLAGGAGRPLYDGVVPAEAYRWLDPPPGEHGDPQSATASIAVTGSKSPLVVVATGESPPQAQLFAIPGALPLPHGTTEIEVSVSAIEPPAASPLPDSHLSGNVYRISVTSQAGTPLTALAASQVSIVLRAPDEALADATIGRFDGTSWQPLDTSPAGIGASFVAVVTEFGDFAVFAPGAEPTATPPASGPPASEPGGSIASAPPTDSGAPIPSPPPAAGANPDRTILTVVLGGAALVIVLLVAVATLAPRRGARRRR